MCVGGRKSKTLAEKSVDGASPMTTVEGETTTTFEGSYRRDANDFLDISSFIL